MRTRCPTSCYYLLLGALVALLVVAGCRRDTRHPAERVVARYYIGISERDTDAVMDAVEAADRNMTGMGLLNVLDALSLEIGFVGIDLGALTATSIRQLRLDVVTRTADYALVQAQGNIRYQTFGYEVPFCFMHDVRRAGGAAGAHLAAARGGGAGAGPSGRRVAGRADGFDDRFAGFGHESV
jgi:hypothetical protein